MFLLARVWVVKASPFDHVMSHRCSALTVSHDSASSSSRALSTSTACQGMPAETPRH